MKRGAGFSKWAVLGGRRGREKASPTERRRLGLKAKVLSHLEGLQVQDQRLPHLAPPHLIKGKGYLRGATTENSNITREHR